MSGVNGQQFGHFTYKNRDYDLKQFDVNHNGKLEKTEVDALLERIAQETGEDILELSNVVNSHDINKDGNLDINEMNRWQIEDGINAKVSAFDATISADFIGDLAQYQSRARADVRAFAQQFINDAVNNMANGNVNLQTIASQFETQLNTQYTTVIKPEYERLCNEANKDKTISNITDDAVNYIVEKKIAAGEELSDTQIERLGDWIYAKVTEMVNGASNFDYTQILNDIKAMLDEVPADMTNDEVFQDWNSYSSEIEDAGVYIDQTELTNLKTKAKALISYAMSKGVKFQQNGHDITVNNMNNLIEREFGGSSGGHKLIEWVNKLKGAIESVNGLSRAELIAYGAEEIKVDIDTGVVGDIPKLDRDTMMGVVQGIIEKVMGGKEGVADQSASVRAKLAQLLRNDAERFVDAYTGNSLSDFSNKLETRLNNYFDKPITQEVLDKAGQLKTEVNAINTVDPSDDIDTLKDILARLDQAIKETGLEVVDKNGRPLDLSNIRVEVSTVDEVVALINTIINHIQSYDNGTDNITLMQLISNNKVYVDTDTGNVGIYIDPAVVEPIINNSILNAINELNVTEHQSEIANRLKEYALYILQNYTDNDLSRLEEWLTPQLEMAITNPAIVMTNYLGNCFLGDKENYTVLCGDENFRKLENALKGFISLAKTLGIELQDNQGGELTAAKILQNYNKENAGELFDLIENIKMAISSNNDTMETMFETMENGIFKLTITGTAVSTMNTDQAIQSAIDEVSGDKLTLARRLAAYAMLILPNCPHQNPDDIKTWLVAELNKLKSQPGSTFVNTYNDLYPLGGRSEYSVNCTDAKLKELKDAFKGLLQLANAVGITLHDPNGNVMTEAYLSKFNKNNADTLWQIINKYKIAIAASFNKTTLNNANGLTIGFGAMVRTDTGVNDITYYESYERHDSKSGARRDVDVQLADKLLKWAQNLCAEWGIAYNYQYAYDLYIQIRTEEVDEHGWYSGGKYCCHDDDACRDTKDRFVKKFSKYVGQQI